MKYQGSIIYLTLVLAAILLLALFSLSDEEPAITTETVLKVVEAGAMPFLIGGYDPVILSENLIILLRDNHLIHKKELKKLEEIIEKRMDGGLIFDGINLLQFNETALNALIKNHKISKRQARKIIEASENSGGILISGYNIVVLEIETLNTLVENDYLDLDIAQKALDNAKPPEAKE